MSTAIVFDTETTGLDAPALIEAAWIPVSFPPSGLVADHAAAECHRFNPGRPIDLGASATHHIFAEDLEGYPPATDFHLTASVEYLIGHQIDFDWAVIGKPPVRRICTLALARAVWPSLDSHSLVACFYHLRGAAGREMATGAHSAAVDVAMNVTVLEQLASAATGLEDLWRASEAARIPKTMPFGKHRGTAISQVPADYVRWLRRQTDINPYLLKALDAARTS